MANVMKMMKQAASLQRKMGGLKRDLAKRTVAFSSGGGKVTAVAGADQTVRRLSIDPSVVDPSAVRRLESLVLAAVQGALAAARQEAAEEMGKLTGELGLPPGMKIPGL